MPVPLFNKIIKKHKANRADLEKYWNEAKEAAHKTYGKVEPIFWGTTMRIFKAKIKKHMNINLDKKDFKESTFQEMVETILKEQDEGN